jgi:hypothetical protein
MVGSLWPSVENGWQHVSRADFFTIDPGLDGTGWALWSGKDFGNLVTPIASGGMRPVWTNPEGEELPWQYCVAQFASRIVNDLRNRFSKRDVGLFYIEEPAFMEGGKGMVTARSGALLKLMSLYGALLGVASGPGCFHVVPVRVAEWKGQTPKEIIARRVLKRLPNLSLATKASHEMDAVGIGLYVKGQM